MTHRPDFDNFVQLARQAPLVPVFRQLVSDTLTPVSAFCQIRTGGCSFLFESVERGENVGRYSFVGFEPRRSLKFDRRRIRGQSAKHRLDLKLPSNERPSRIELWLSCEPVVLQRPLQIPNTSGREPRYPTEPHCDCRRLLHPLKQILCVKGQHAPPDLFVTAGLRPCRFARPGS